MAGYYDTRTLLEAKRQIPSVLTFLRDRFTRTGKTFPTKTVEIEYMKGKRRLAPYVSELLPGKVIARDGRTVSVIEPALIKPARPITTIDLSKRGFGEDPYSGKTPEERAEELIASDMIDLDDTITRREEVALSELIFSGKVTQIGEGVSQIIDYNFTNKEILTGPTLWSEDTSNIVGDLVHWKQLVAKASGGAPGVLLVATDVANAFIENAKIQKLLDIRGFTLGGVAPRPPVGGATYIGYLNYPGVEIWSYDEWYLDDTDLDGNGDPKLKPMVPAGTVAFLPTDPLFTFHYGGITIMGDDGNFRTIEGDRVPESWAEKSPAVRWLQISSKPLPVPVNSDAWYVAKVLE
ncbi:major capsid protein [Cohnella sp. GCM10012308]|uniref:major capsid protein n=1 Tax=Cohnella sp. GCM10012308 TaxID=3317329 RepID=UPI003605F659